MKHVMQLCVLLISLLITHTLSALTIDEATQKKLGIQSQRPLPLPNTSQNYPAQVVLPQQNQQSVSLSHTATLLNWHVEPYQNITLGQPLARLFSNTLLEASHSWLIARNKEQFVAQQEKREQSLFEQGLIPKKRLDIAQSEAKQAHITTLMAAQQCLHLGLSKNDLQSILVSGIPTGEFTLLAKMTGRIIKLETHQGRTINPGEPLLSYQNGDTRWLEFSLPALEAQTLQTGETIALNNLNQKAILVGQQPERNTAQKIMFLAKIEDAANLMPGQWITVRLNSPSLSTFEIPRQAVIHLNNQAHIFILQDESIKKQAVDILGSTRTGWQIRASTLTEDDAVVVQGSAAIKALLDGEPNHE